MIEQLKYIIDYISAPTISFTLLTVLFLLIFPPTDWFDMINKKGFIQKEFIEGIFENLFKSAGLNKSATLQDIYTEDNDKQRWLDLEKENNDSLNTSNDNNAGKRNR